MSNENITQIASRNDFLDAVRAALEQAALNGATEIYFVDPHFSDWPLNERGLIESLTRWVSSRRKLTIVAHNFDEVARRSPRFAEWRRQWSHVVHCRSADEIEADQVPTLLYVAGFVCVRLLDRVRYRGTVSGRASDHVESREAIDALLQRSTEAFPPTTLGL
jgi:hypothetical protein